MKEVKRKVFGVEFVNQEPATAEEYDKLGKEVGLCVADANNQVFFHSQASAIRGGTVDALETVTGGRKQKTEEREKDGKKITVVVEKDGDYVESAIAEGWLTRDKLAEIVREQATKHTFDPSVSVRTAGPKKLPEQYANAASRIFDQGKADRAAKKYGLALTGDRTKDIDLIGWAVRAEILEAERSQLEKVVGKI